MGQYHYLVNFDRKEIVHPYKLGNGLKQLEHTGWPASLSDALYMLVCTSPAAWGGDLEVNQTSELEFESFGRWVWDRVTVFWNYTEVEPFCRIEKMCPNNWMDKYPCINDYIDSFADISDQILPAFELAMGVTISQGDGWRDQKLLSSRWSWLFPNLNDEKTAES